MDKKAHIDGVGARILLSYQISTLLDKGERLAHLATRHRLVKANRAAKAAPKLAVAPIPAANVEQDGSRRQVLANLSR